MDVNIVLLVDTHNADKTYEGTTWWDICPEVYTFVSYDGTMTESVGY